MITRGSHFIDKRVHLLLTGLGNVAFSSVTWVLVGVPAAGIICAAALSFYVILAFHQMAITAAVLGAIQGLWLQLIGRSQERSRPELIYAGALSGCILGLFGFPPAFSDTELVITNNIVIVLFVSAAVFGGTAAGIVSALVTTPVRTPASSLLRKIAIGCLLLLPLATAERFLFWPGTADKLPVQEVTQKAIARLSAGNARGSAWSGCYWYWGRLSGSSGGNGGQSGLLRIRQFDGLVYVVLGNDTELKGGVDRKGDFRFGGENQRGGDIMRDLWEGRFHKDSLEYIRRMTVLRPSNLRDNIKLIGTAKSVPCPGK